MNEHELRAGLRAVHLERTRYPDMEAVRQHALSIPFEQVPQKRGWLPPIDTGRFQSLFSASKLVVAGSLVALFSGLLLAGVLTQPQDVDAPIAGSTPTASSTPLADSARTDLLPGVELVTRELSPTVFQVLDDGAGHDLSRMRLNPVVRTPDGGTWVWAGPKAGSEEGPDRVFRLGEPGSFAAADGVREAVGRIEVGADGRVYVQVAKLRKGNPKHWVVRTDEGWVAASSDDRAAARHRPDPSVGASVEAADGATWKSTGEGAFPKDIVRIGPDGRTRFTVEDMNFDWGKKGPVTTGIRGIRPLAFAAAPDGRVWVLWGPNPAKSSLDNGVGLAEFDGQTWTDITPPEWRADKYLGRDHPQAGIRGASLSVEPDSTLRARLEFHDSRIHRGSGGSSAPFARLEASWNGTRWTAESGTTWDLASLAETPAAEHMLWLADVASDGTMLLVTWDPEKDSGLYLIRPQIDDDPDEAELMAP